MRGRSGAVWSRVWTPPDGCRCLCPRTPLGCHSWSSPTLSPSQKANELCLPGLHPGLPHRDRDHDRSHTASSSSGHPSISSQKCPSTSGSETKFTPPRDSGLPPPKDASPRETKTHTGLTCPPQFICLRTESIISPTPSPSAPQVKTQVP